MIPRVASISSTLAVFTPWLIFAPRRINRSFDESNPVNAALDIQIGTAQTANAFKGAVKASQYADSDLAKEFLSADEKIKNMSKAAAEGEKVLGYLGKIIKFTMNNINKFIGIGECVKVAFSDNKERDAIIGGTAFGTMIISERIGNNLMGRSKTKLENGNLNLNTRNAKYKNYGWLNSRVEDMKNALNEYSQTKNFMSKYAKYMPGVIKGLVFALVFSIGGYNLGKTIGTGIADNVAPLKEAA